MVEESGMEKVNALWTVKKVLVAGVSTKTDLGAPATWVEAKGRTISYFLNERKNPILLAQNIPSFTVWSQPSVLASFCIVEKDWLLAVTRGTARTDWLHVTKHFYSNYA